MGILHSLYFKNIFLNSISLEINTMDNQINKVAQVTIYFWIMKICATTLGETAGDLLSMTLNIGYAFSSMILMGCF
jgi:uncharacterized membrane-anchored protein